MNRIELFNPYYGFRSKFSFSVVTLGIRLINTSAIQLTERKKNTFIAWSGALNTNHHHKHKRIDGQRSTIVDCLINFTKFVFCQTQWRKKGLFYGWAIDPKENKQH